VVTTKMRYQRQSAEAFSVEGRFQEVSEAGRLSEKHPDGIEVFPDASCWLFKKPSAAPVPASEIPGDMKSRYVALPFRPQKKKPGDVS